jgi:hypothetical protein
MFQRQRSELLAAQHGQQNPGNLDRSRPDDDHKQTREDEKD